MERTSDSATELAERCIQLAVGKLSWIAGLVQTGPPRKVFCKGKHEAVMRYALFQITGSKLLIYSLQMLRPPNNESTNSTLPTNHVLGMFIVKTGIIEWTNIHTNYKIQDI